MSKVDEKVDQLKGILEATETRELERIGSYRLSDAIREGCKVSDKAEDWIVGDNLCALSAAVVAAKARGYAK